MRVSYSGYYESLPRTRGGFNSPYPLILKSIFKMLFKISCKRANCFAREGELKTAAMRDELSGESRCEGRPASAEAEAEATCRKFPLPAP